MNNRSHTLRFSFLITLFLLSTPAPLQATEPLRLDFLSSFSKSMITSLWEHKKAAAVLCMLVFGGYLYKQYTNKYMSENVHKTVIGNTTVEKTVLLLMPMVR